MSVNEILDKLPDVHFSVQWGAVIAVLAIGLAIAIGIQVFKHYKYLKVNVDVNRKTILSLLAFLATAGALLESVVGIVEANPAIMGFAFFGEAVFFYYASVRPIYKKAVYVNGILKQFETSAAPAAEQLPVFGGAEA